MKCVDKHKDEALTAAQEEKVCAVEFKAMRLQAFEKKLFYHYVNKRFFMNELAIFNNEAAF